MEYKKWDTLQCNHRDWTHWYDAEIQAIEWDEWRQMLWLRFLTWENKGKFSWVYVHELDYTVTKKNESKQKIQHRMDQEEKDST